MVSIATNSLYIINCKFICFAGFLTVQTNHWTIHMWIDWTVAIHSVVSCQREGVNWSVTMAIHHSPSVGLEDMAKLTDLKDDSILENLKLRYKHDQIYVS